MALLKREEVIHKHLYYLTQPIFEFIVKKDNNIDVTVNLYSVAEIAKKFDLNLKTIRSYVSRYATCTNTISRNHKGEFRETLEYWEGILAKKIQKKHLAI